jgi:hypothetical protein
LTDKDRVLIVVVDVSVSMNVPKIVIEEVKVVWKVVMLVVETREDKVFVLDSKHQRRTSARCRGHTL